MNSEKENQNNIIPFAIPEEFPINFGIEDPENWGVEEIKSNDSCEEVKDSKVKQLTHPKNQSQN